MVSISGSDEFCKAIDRILDMESEGRLFYLECAEHTPGKTLQGLFVRLSREEGEHRRKMLLAYHHFFNKGFCRFQERDRTAPRTSSLFREYESGLDAGGREDESNLLDACIRFEKKLVYAYEALVKDAMGSNQATLYAEILEEERRHQAVLEKEAEAISNKRRT